MTLVSFPMLPYLIVFVFGAMVGSVLNGSIVRLPIGSAQARESLLPFGLCRQVVLARAGKCELCI